MWHRKAGCWIRECTAGCAYWCEPNESSIKSLMFSGLGVMPECMHARYDLMYAAAFYLHCAASNTVIRSACVYCHQFVGVEFWHEVHDHECTQDVHNVDRMSRWLVIVLWSVDGVICSWNDDLLFYKYKFSWLHVWIKILSEYQMDSVSSSAVIAIWLYCSQCK